MREIITRWTTPAGSGFLNVMYFNSVVPIADQRAALGVLWEAMEPILATSIEWRVDDSGRVLDPGTGEVVSDWVEPTSQTGSGGDVTGGVVPDAAQILLQWSTPVRRDGRRVRGRTFVPGLGGDELSAGNMSAGAQAVASAAVLAFLAEDSGFGVWSRPRAADPAHVPPVTARAGLFVDVDGASVWPELAVQRGRRK